ncbi:neuronal acetylcholine receptor subunit alpha-5-like [Mercenaria mercenaria]|uniref:neuronal acetylcholine receptor subunit alpha-5-like n=1 Tax=Mercenaria mercenaria TaxID=6596 RepID=UPI00234F551B|nr:neuronal acetylcholine receptor subunit alpha-5-like [Mercenaria mercenaria]
MHHHLSCFLFLVIKDDVWKPDVTLYNSANNYIALGHKTILIENDENGSMSWAPMEVFESSCSVDMTYYPYDIQTCELQFMSWSYDDDTVTLSMADDTVQLEDYSTNAQWDILSTNVSYVNETAGAYVDLISFKIKLQRKPRHHLITLFLPIILLAVSEIFVFALPSDGGEKSGYAVTVFLAFAVFLTIVNTAMPANSEKVSIFSVYLVIQTAQSTLITILSLLSIRCASLDETTRIPSGFVALVRLSQCGCKETNAPKSNRIGNMDEVSEVEKNGSSCSLDDKEETETCSWKMVTNAVDKICFMVFSAVFVITTTVCFCVIFLAPD